MHAPPTTQKGGLGLPPAEDVEFTNVCTRRIAASPPSSDLHRSIFPVARRVLGPDHFLTRRLQNPALLEALGITDE